MAQNGQTDAAIRESRRALWYQPQNKHAHYNLALALDDEGDFAGGIPEYREALAIDGKYAVGHAYLGSALGRSGDWASAIRKCQTALSLEPRAGHVIKTGSGSLAGEKIAHPALL